MESRKAKSVKIHSYRGSVAILPAWLRTAAAPAAGRGSRARPGRAPAAARSDPGSTARPKPEKEGRRNENVK